MPEKAQKTSLDPGEVGISRRYLRHLWVATVQEQRLHPRGEKMMETMGILGQRVWCDWLWKPPAQESLTVDDVRKILRISQLEKICVKECWNVDQGLELANNLDESGSVIIIVNTVFLMRPEQLVEAIQALVHFPSAGKCCADSRTKELQEMEKQKEAIDKNSESQPFTSLAAMRSSSERPKSRPSKGFSGAGLGRNRNS